MNEVPKVKKKIDKTVDLEILVDNYLKNDIPLSFIEEEYDLTERQKRKMWKMVEEFEAQVEVLNNQFEEYGVAKYGDSFLTIPHKIEEKGLYDYSKLIPFFEKKAKLKEELDNLVIPNIEEIQKNVSTCQEELAKFDEHKSKIFYIEHFINDYDEAVMLGFLTPEYCTKLLQKYNIVPSEVPTLNNMYHTYCEAKKRFDEATTKYEQALKEKNTIEKARNNIQREIDNLEEQLIIYNIKLVNWCIRYYFKNIPISKEDAQAVGFIALLTAIRKFDYKLGSQFSTFAVKVIKKERIKKVKEELLSLAPDHKDISSYELSESGLLPYTPTQIENSNQLPDFVYNFSDIQEELETDFKPTRRNEMPISFEDYEKIDDYENQAVFETQTPDVNQIDIPEQAFSKLLKENLTAVLDTLSENEKLVITLRFGLSPEHPDPLTLEEVAKEFNATRERIRQIEAKVIRKLRHPARSKNLKGFLYPDDSSSTAKYYESAYEKLEEMYKKILYLQSFNFNNDTILTFVRMSNFDIQLEELERHIEILEKIKKIIKESYQKGNTNPEIITLKVNRYAREIRDLRKYYYLEFSKEFILHVINSMNLSLDNSVPRM